MAQQPHMNFPDFISNDIVMYFILVDQYFTHYNIDNQVSMFNLLTSHLPSEVLSKIRHLIVDRPPRNAYNVLRQALSQHYNTSPTDQVHTLINDLQFSSSCMDLLQETLKLSHGHNLPDAFLKSLIFSKLPSCLQTHALSLGNNLSLHNYCERLDRIFKITSKSNITTSELKLDHLTHALADVKLQVTDINNHLNKHTQPVSFQYPSNPSRNFQSNHQTQSNLCYYHQKYGNRAFKCNGFPCPMQKN